MLFLYYAKKVVLNKLFLLISLIILIINLIILPSLNKNISLNYLNYKSFIDTFIVINLGVGLIFGGIILIILYREPRDSGIELWMTAMPFSRNQIFFHKFLIFFSLIFFYCLLVPLIFLGLLHAGYNPETSKNDAYGILELNHNFGNALGILLGGYLLFILFFSAIYLIFTLYFRQIFIIIFIFVISIIFVVFSFIPKFGKAKNGILQYDLQQDSINLDKPLKLSINDLDLEIQNNEDIYGLEKTQDYLSDLATNAQRLDDALFGENSFSQISIQRKEKNDKLDLLNPFTYFELSIIDIYQPVFSDLSSTNFYYGTKSKKLVKKNTPLSNATAFAKKEELLATRFANLQMISNNLLGTTSELSDMLLDEANPINSQKIEAKITYINSLANNIFSSFTSYSTWDDYYLDNLKPLSESEVNWDLIKDQDGNKLILNDDLKDTYLKLLALVQSDPNLVFDTEYVNIIPSWAIYLIFIPLIIGLFSLAYYLHRKLIIR